MITPQQIAIKYCKTLLASGSSLTPDQATHFLAKLVYEFWGFCVNGGTSQTVPGGFAAVNMPTGFDSGSTTLLATGNDGFTTFASDVFASQNVNFQALHNSYGLIGKYLVTWVPGDSSTDDSVYFIKSVEDGSHIKLDVHSGGTRRLGNHPWFWDRQGISFRIVDFIAATMLTGSGFASSSWEGNNMVLQLTAAPVVNPGQALSEFKLATHTNSAGTGGNIGIQISPSGSWNGTAFTDGAPEVTASFFNPAANPGLSTYTLIGGGDFLIAEARGPIPQGTFTAGSGFHVEVPQRLYPQANDPNPVAWLLWQNAVPSQVAATYYNGFSMVGYDGNVYQWTSLVRSLGGTQVPPAYSGVGYGNGQWQQFTLPNFRFGFIAFDPVGDPLGRDRYMTTDAVMSLSGSQFSLARCRLRRARFTTATLSRGARLGDPITDPNGWIVVSNGVLWPWDDSIMPFGPWWAGV